MRVRLCQSDRASCGHAVWPSLRVGLDVGRGQCRVRVWGDCISVILSVSVCLPGVMTLCVCVCACACMRMLKSQPLVMMGVHVSAWGGCVCVCVCACPAPSLKGLCCVSACSWGLSCISPQGALYRCLGCLCAWAGCLWGWV